MSSERVLPCKENDPGELVGPGAEGSSWFLPCTETHFRNIENCQSDPDRDFTPTDSGTHAMGLESHEMIIWKFSSSIASSRFPSGCWLYSQSSRALFTDAPQLTDRLHLYSLKNCGSSPRRQNLLCSINSTFASTRPTRVALKWRFLDRMDLILT